MGGFRNNRLMSRKQPDWKHRFDYVSAEDSAEQKSINGSSSSSSSSFDRFCVDILGLEGSIMDSPQDPYWDGSSSTSTSSISSAPAPNTASSITSTSVESSPIRWPRASREKSRLGKSHFLPTVIDSKEAVTGQESKHEEILDTSEIETMKKRFAKLLLGEDLSGGGRGVSSALALSNAITNLSASVFGGLWKLEPLPEERKARWKREMGWLLSVSDHIVEFVASSQTLPDGNMTEVMISKPRSDLHMNLPALKKLDAMLIEALDSFHDTEFWYLDQARAMTEKDSRLLQRREEKWWLPIPRVPVDGLSDGARKHLLHQKKSIGEVLKAVLAINAQVLSEVEIPAVYWDALPKNGKSSLGDALYRRMTSEGFSADALVASLGYLPEHGVLELVNRVEAAIHIWRRKIHTRQPFNYNMKGGKGNSSCGNNSNNSSMRSSWGLDGLTIDLERREQLAEKAESLLLLLRHKFPGLRQTILDENKILHNKDVGHSILESYSRVLESLAFNILSRIDNVLQADDDQRKAKTHGMLLSRNSSLHRSLTTNQGKASLFSGLSKSASIHSIGCGSPPPRSFHGKSLSDYIGWSHILKGDQQKQMTEHRNCTESPMQYKQQWSHSGSFLHLSRSPPSRD